MIPGKRVALVTGAGRRIGRAIALNLAQAGCDVAVHYRKSCEDAEATARDVRLCGRNADVFRWDFAAEPDAARLVAQVCDKLGRLDILVNNASWFIPEGEPTPPDFSLDIWQQMLAVNVIAPASLCFAAARVMRDRGSGRIVNLCDACWDRPWANYPAYCASKAALASLTRSLALSLAPDIQVNGVSPGIIEFPESFTPEVRERLIRKVPARRSGRVEEIAEAVRFLIEGPAYLTGQIVAVDGGRGLR
ncbi:MAG: Glucose 1-dehydrogenase [Phycisphaerae bacterium]|nr:Glucose 1-dehydrogenase [Phycisphaerae bacterium]